MSNETDDTRSALRGLLVPAYFLLLIAVGVWVLVPDNQVSDSGRTLYAVIFVGSIGAAVILFVLQWRRGIIIDKRNWMDVTGFAGFPWRKRIAEDQDQTDRRNPR